MPVEPQCFVCGTPTTAEMVSGVRICDSCKLKQQRIDGGVHWMARRSEADVDGPLTRNQVLEAIAMGRLDANHEICRVGEDWLFVTNHPDYSGCFDEYDPQFVIIEKIRVEHRNQIARAAASKVKFGVSLLATTALAVLAPPFIYTTELGLLPDGAMTTIEGWLAPTIEVEPPPGKMVGDALIVRLSETITPLEEPATMALHQGRAAVWGHGSLAVARPMLEAALVANPHDVDIIGALTEVYALSLRDQPNLTEDMMTLATRCEALSPGSVAGLRARSLALLVTGNTSASTSLAAECVGGLPNVVELNGDLGCLANAVDAQGDVAALSRITDQFPDAARVGLREVEYLLSRDDPATALSKARGLAERFPTMPGVQSAIGQASALMGNFEKARPSLEEAFLKDALDVPAGHLVGEIALKVDGDAEKAVRVLTAVSDVPGFRSRLQAPRVLSDLAQAHLALGDPEAAMKAADAALEIDKRLLSAHLARAQAWWKKGDAYHADEALGHGEALEPEGTDAAWYYLYGGQLFRDMDRMDNARRFLVRADASVLGAWPEIHLAAAEVALQAEDLKGSMDSLQRIPFTYVAGREWRSPLRSIWSPPQDTKALRRRITDTFMSDIRFKQNASNIGLLVGWLNDDRGAMNLLASRAVNAGASAQVERSLYLHAAAAQIRLQQGQLDAAMKHIDRVLADDSRESLFRALRGRVLLERGRRAEALEEFEQASGTTGQMSIGQLWWAEANIEFKATHAVEALIDIREQAPDNLEVRRLLLMALESQAEG